jgi:hypothetical protein
VLRGGLASADCFDYTSADVQPQEDHGERQRREGDAHGGDGAPHGGRMGIDGIERPAHGEGSQSVPGRWTSALCWRERGGYTRL